MYYLTDIVRAAAAQYAASQGTPVVHAVAQGYLVGYAAGYRADRTARFPLAGDQAFKRLLGQYLAENIDVYHPATGRTGLLRGLPGCYSHDGEPFADVEFYADAEAREEGGGDLMEDVGKILPVLYSFEDLATEVELADGRRVVPAVEVAKLLAKQEHSHPGDAAYAGVKHYAGFIEVYYDGVLMLISPNGTAFYEGQGFQPFYAGDILRQWHFAVGLRPEQYHRKQVAKPEVRICDCETDPPCHCGEGEASHRLGGNEHSFVAMPTPCTNDCEGCTGGKLVVSLMCEPILDKLPF